MLTGAILSAAPADSPVRIRLARKAPYLVSRDDHMAHAK